MALGNHRTTECRPRLRLGMELGTETICTHQFNVTQVDLNYSVTLQRELKNVLSFWLDRGVDGFRIDVISHLFEDARYLDEPGKPRKDVPGIPDDDYEVLDHVYTKNLLETYEVLKSWRELLDNHSKMADTKIIWAEADTDFALYYNSGSNVQFYVQS